MATVEPHYHRSNVLAEFVNRSTSEIRILTDPDGITKGGFDATRIIATTMRDLARSADDLLRLLVLGALERDSAFFFNGRVLMGPDPFLGAEEAVMCSIATGNVDSLLEGELMSRFVATSGMMLEGQPFTLIHSAFLPTEGLPFVVGRGMRVELPPPVADTPAMRDLWAQVEINFRRNLVCHPDLRAAATIARSHDGSLRLLRQPELFPVLSVHPKARESPLPSTVFRLNPFGLMMSARRMNIPVDDLVLQNLREPEAVPNAATRLVLRLVRRFVHVVNSGAVTFVSEDNFRNVLNEYAVPSCLAGVVRSQLRGGHARDVTLHALVAFSISNLLEEVRRSQLAQEIDRLRHRLGLSVEARRALHEQVETLLGCKHWRFPQNPVFVYDPPIQRSDDEKGGAVSKDEGKTAKESKPEGEPKVGKNAAKNAPAASATPGAAPASTAAVSTASTEATGSAEGAAAGGGGAEAAGVSGVSGVASGDAKDRDASAGSAEETGVLGGSSAPPGARRTPLGYYEPEGVTDDGMDDGRRAVFEGREDDLVQESTALHGSASIVDPHLRLDPARPTSPPSIPTISGADIARLRMAVDLALITFLNAVFAGGSVPTYLVAPALVKAAKEFKVPADTAEGDAATTHGVTEGAKRIPSAILAEFQRSIVEEKCYVVPDLAASAGLHAMEVLEALAPGEITSEELWSTWIPATLRADFDETHTLGPEYAVLAPEELEAATPDLRVLLNPLRTLDSVLRLAGLRIGGFTRARIESRLSTLFPNTPTFASLSVAHAPFAVSSEAPVLAEESRVHRELTRDLRFLYRWGGVVRLPTPLEVLEMRAKVTDTDVPSDLFATDYLMRFRPNLRKTAPRGRIAQMVADMMEAFAKETEEGKTDGFPMDPFGMQELDMALSGISHYKTPRHPTSLTPAVDPHGSLAELVLGARFQAESFGTRGASRFLGDLTPRLERSTAWAGAPFESAGGPLATMLGGRMFDLKTSLVTGVFEGDNLTDSETPMGAIGDALIRRLTMLLDVLTDKTSDMNGDESIIPSFVFALLADAFTRTRNLGHAVWANALAIQRLPYPKEQFGVPLAALILNWANLNNLMGRQCDRMDLNTVVRRFGPSHVIRPDSANAARLAGMGKKGGAADASTSSEAGAGGAWSVPDLMARLSALLWTTKREAPRTGASGESESESDADESLLHDPGKMRDAFDTMNLAAITNAVARARLKTPILAVAARPPSLGEFRTFIHVTTIAVQSFALSAGVFLNQTRKLTGAPEPHLSDAYLSDDVLASVPPASSPLATLPALVSAFTVVPKFAHGQFVDRTDDGVVRILRCVYSLAPTPEDAEAGNAAAMLERAPYRHFRDRVLQNLVSPAGASVFLSMTGMDTRSAAQIFSTSQAGVSAPFAAADVEDSSTQVFGMGANASALFLNFSALRLLLSVVGPSNPMLARPLLQIAHLVPSIGSPEVVLAKVNILSHATEIVDAGFGVESAPALIPRLELALLLAQCSSSTHPSCLPPSHITRFNAAETARNLLRQARPVLRFLLREKPWNWKPNDTTPFDLHPLSCEAEATALDSLRALELAQRAEDEGTSTAAAGGAGAPAPSASSAAAAAAASSSSSTSSSSSSGLHPAFDPSLEHWEVRVLESTMWTAESYLAPTASQAFVFADRAFHALMVPLGDLADAALDNHELDSTVVDAWKRGEDGRGWNAAVPGGSRLQALLRRLAVEEVPGMAPHLLSGGVLQSRHLLDALLALARAVRRLHAELDAEAAPEPLVPAASATALPTFSESVQKRRSLLRLALSIAASARVIANRRREYVRVRAQVSSPCVSDDTSEVVAFITSVLLELEAVGDWPDGVTPVPNDEASMDEWVDFLGRLSPEEVVAAIASTEPEATGSSGVGEGANAGAASSATTTAAEEAFAQTKTGKSITEMVASVARAHSTRWNRVEATIARGLHQANLDFEAISPTCVGEMISELFLRFTLASEPKGVFRGEQRPPGLTPPRAFIRASGLALDVTPPTSASAAAPAASSAAPRATGSSMFARALGIAPTGASGAGGSDPWAVAGAAASPVLYLTAAAQLADWFSGVSGSDRVSARRGLASTTLQFWAEQMATKPPVQTSLRAANTTLTDVDLLLRAIPSSAIAQAWWDPVVPPPALNSTPSALSLGGMGFALSLMGAALGATTDDRGRAGASAGVGGVVGTGLGLVPTQARLLEESERARIDTLLDASTSIAASLLVAEMVQFVAAEEYVEFATSTLAPAATWDSARGLAPHVLPSNGGVSWGGRGASPSTPSSAPASAPAASSSPASGGGGAASASASAAVPTTSAAAPPSAPDKTPLGGGSIATLQLAIADLRRQGREADAGLLRDQAHLAGLLQRVGRNWLTKEPWLLELRKQRTLTVLTSPIVAHFSVWYLAHALGRPELTFDASMSLAFDIKPNEIPDVIATGRGTVVFPGPRGLTSRVEGTRLRRRVRIRRPDPGFLRDGIVGEASAAVPGASAAATSALASSASTAATEAAASGVEGAEAAGAAAGAAPAAEDENPTVEIVVSADVEARTFRLSADIIPSAMLVDPTVRACVADIAMRIAAPLGKSVGGGGQLNVTGARKLALFFNFQFENESITYLTTILGRFVRVAWAIRRIIYRAVSHSLGCTLEQALAELPVLERRAPLLSCGGLSHRALTLVHPVLSDALFEGCVMRPGFDVDPNATFARVANQFMQTVTGGRAEAVVGRLPDFGRHAVMALNLDSPDRGLHREFFFFNPSTRVASFAVMVHDEAFNPAEEIRHLFFMGTPEGSTPIMNGMAVMDVPNDEGGVLRNRYVFLASTVWSSPGINVVSTLREALSDAQLMSMSILANPADVRHGPMRQHMEASQEESIAAFLEDAVELRGNAIVGGFGGPRQEVDTSRLRTLRNERATVAEAALTPTPFDRRAGALGATERRFAGILRTLPHLRARARGTYQDVATHPATLAGSAGYRHFRAAPLALAPQVMSMFAPQHTILLGVLCQLVKTEQDIVDFARSASATMTEGVWMLGEILNQPALQALALTAFLLAAMQQRTVTESALARWEQPRRPSSRTCFTDAEAMRCAEMLEAAQACLGVPVQDWVIRNTCELSGQAWWPPMAGPGEIHGMAARAHASAQDARTAVYGSFHPAVMTEAVAIAARTLIVDGNVFDAYNYGFLVPLAFALSGLDRTLIDHVRAARGEAIEAAGPRGTLLKTSIGLSLAAIRTTSPMAPIPDEVWAMVQIGEQQLWSSLLFVSSDDFIVSTPIPGGWDRFFEAVIANLGAEDVEAEAADGVRSFARFVSGALMTSVAEFTSSGFVPGLRKQFVDPSSPLFAMVGKAIVAGSVKEWSEVAAEDVLIRGLLGDMDTRAVARAAIAQLDLALRSANAEASGDEDAADAAADAAPQLSVSEEFSDVHAFRILLSVGMSENMQKAGTFPVWLFRRFLTAEGDSRGVLGFLAALSGREALFSASQAYIAPQSCPVDVKYDAMTHLDDEALESVVLRRFLLRHADAARDLVLPSLAPIAPWPRANTVHPDRQMDNQPEVVPLHLPVLTWQFWNDAFARGFGTDGARGLDLLVLWKEAASAYDALCAAEARPQYKLSRRLTATHPDFDAVRKAVGLRVAWLLQTAAWDPVACDLLRDFPFVQDGFARLDPADRFSLEMARLWLRSHGPHVLSVPVVGDLARVGAPGERIQKARATYLESVADEEVIRFEHTPSPVEVEFFGPEAVNTTGRRARARAAVEELAAVDGVSATSSSVDEDAVRAALARLVAEQAMMVEAGAAVSSSSLSSSSSSAESSSSSSKATRSTSPRASLTALLSESARFTCEQPHWDSRLPIFEMATDLLSALVLVPAAELPALLDEWIEAGWVAALIQHTATYPTMTRFRDGGAGLLLVLVAHILHTGRDGGPTFLPDPASSDGAAGGRGAVEATTSSASSSSPFARYSREHLLASLRLRVGGPWIRFLRMKDPAEMEYAGVPLLLHLLFSPELPAGPTPPATLLADPAPASGFHESRANLASFSSHIDAERVVLETLATEPVAPDAYRAFGAALDAVVLGKIPWPAVLQRTTVRLLSTANLACLPGPCHVAILPFLLGWGNPVVEPHLRVVAVRATGSADAPLAALTEALVPFVAFPAFLSTRIVEPQVPATARAAILHILNSPSEDVARTVRAEFV